MSKKYIQNEIIKVSQEALKLVSEIAAFWDRNVSEYVEAEQKKAA